MTETVTGAGWFGITAGLVGGAVTIGAGFFLEDYKRHRDRCATAMAYLGEIKTLVDLSKRLDLSGEAKRVADVLRPLPSLPPGFGTSKPFSIPNPVFDKAADKIGVFSGDMPMWISEFYNYVVGLRLAYFEALASGFCRACYKCLRHFQQISHHLESGAHSGSCLLITSAFMYRIKAVSGTMSRQDVLVCNSPMRYYFEHFLQNSGHQINLPIAICNPLQLSRRPR